MIGADAFQFFVKHSGLQIFSLSIFANEKALNFKHSNSYIQIALERKPSMDFLLNFCSNIKLMLTIFQVPSRITFFTIESMTIRFSLSLEKI